MEIKQLTPEIVLRDPRTAHVVAEHNGDPVLQRGLRAGDDALKDDVSVLLLDLGRVRHAAVKQRIGKGGGDRRAEESAVLPEQVDHLCVRLCAVLDRIHTISERDLDALRGFDMCGDRVAIPVRLLADGLYHLRRHFQLTRHALFLRVEHTAGDHQLHKIDALALRVGKKLQCLLRRMRRRGDRTGHVAAGHGNALIGCQDLRAAGTSRCDLVAQAGIKIAEPAHGADRRNAAQQLKLCIKIK